MAAAKAIERWRVAARQGRRFSATAWRWAINVAYPDAKRSTLTYRARTHRGHARTRRGAERAMDRAAKA